MTIDINLDKCIARFNTFTKFQYRRIDLFHLLYSNNFKSEDLIEANKLMEVVNNLFVQMPDEIKTRYRKQLENFKKFIEEKSKDFPT